MGLSIRSILGFAAITAAALLALLPGTGQAQTPRPDLVVSGVDAPPSTALPGDGFAITANVFNQGTSGAGTSVTKFYLVGAGGVKKNLKGVQNVPALGIGASDASPATLQIYSDTAPGTYTFQACADGDKTVAESNELNNCTNNGSITVFDVPDLEITAVSNPASPVPQGQSFQVTYTVKNVGAVQAAASLVKFYLVSATTKIDLKTDDPEAVGALGPGATFTHAVPVTVRSETVPGSYVLQACADSGKTVVEGDEDDNCKSSQLSMQVTATPDLLVKQVQVAGAPLTVLQGDTITVTLNVRNDGLADAAASTLKFVLLPTTAGLPQKNLKGGTAVPAIPKGTKVPISATPLVYEDTAPGTYTVQACIDSKKVVAESLESNNCATALTTITVAGLPLSDADLAVTALTVPPATRLPGETFEVTASIKNHGSGPSPATTTQFNLLSVADPTKSKNLKGVQSLPAVGAGQTNATAVTVEVYSDTAPGQYFLQACADDDKQINEVDEDDNCFTTAAKITISQVPDLVVTALGNPPASIAPGGGFTATDSIKNVGPVAAGGSQVKFYLVAADDTRTDLSGTQTIPGLQPGGVFNGTQAVTVRPETLPGSYRLQACADSGKQVPESDEDTNCLTASTSVQVLALPDLIVNKVQLPSTTTITVARGGTVVITSVVRNQGPGNAGASALKMSLVTTPGAAPIKNIAGVYDVPAVAPAGKQQVAVTATIPSNTPLGTYLVQSCVDTLKAVTETSESNNCGTSTVAIKVVQ